MPHRRSLAAVAALSMLVATALPAAAQDERPLGPPEATPNPVALETPAGDGTAVRLVTELGDVVIGLFNESAPVASENMLNLVEDGRGAYYLCGRYRNHGTKAAIAACGPGAVLLQPSRPLLRRDRQSARRGRDGSLCCQRSGFLCQLVARR